MGRGHDVEIHEVTIDGLARLNEDVPVMEVVVGWRCFGIRMGPPDVKSKLGIRIVGKRLVPPTRPILAWGHGFQGPFQPQSRMGSGRLVLCLMDRVVGSHQVVGIDVGFHLVPWVVGLVPELEIHEAVGIFGMSDLIIQDGPGHIAGVPGTGNAPSIAFLNANARDEI